MQTATPSWPVAANWGMACLAYCRNAFSVESRIKQLDPANPSHYALETGLMSAAHISGIGGALRASGYLFVVSPIDGGKFFVKRIEDKPFDLPTHSDDVTLGEGNLPGIKLDQYHTLTMSTGDAGEAYFIDGVFACSVPPRGRIAPLRAAGKDRAGGAARHRRQPPVLYRPRHHHRAISEMAGPQSSPAIWPFSFSPMISAECSLRRPGVVMVSPQMTTMSSAPADPRIGATVATVRYLRIIFEGPR